MKRMPLKSGILLFTAAIIWGVAFVAQSEGMDYLEPFTFTGIRYFLGCAVLVPFIAARRMAAGRGRGIDSVEPGADAAGRRRALRNLLTGGICCGLVLCAASMFQQYGILYTSVGKAGFITTLYIIFVPVLGIFLRRKVPPIVWVGALLSVAGMYLLCVDKEAGIAAGLNGGDMMLISCALLFSIHILFIDYFSPKVDGVELSCFQFLVTGIICTVIGFATEHPAPADFLACVVPLCYTGILSSGVAFTFQILGQRDADPAAAALIYSLESVFSVLAGWLLLGQRLSGRELLGCGIVFGAVVLVQLPVRRKDH